MIRAIKMTESLRQLFEELLEVKISKEKEKKRVEGKFFSVYRKEPVYRIHFRSVRRNIETIRRDGKLLGCDIEIHVDPREHMVTSILRK